MADDIKIGVASDTKAFETGVRSGVLSPLEDVEDALKDVDKASGRSGDALQSDLKKSQKETTELAREFKQTAKTIDAEARAMKYSIGDNVKNGTDKASDGMKDFRSESASTARESAASFDGSAQSIGDSFQEIAANAFAGFGPAGALAGLAIAAGIGIGAAAIEQAGELSEETKAKVGELAGEFIETGRSSRSLDSMIDKLKELATTTEDGQTNLAELRKTAKDTDNEYETLAAAFTGNERALDKLVQKVREQRTESMLADAANDKEGTSYSKGTSDKTNALSKLDEKLGETKKLTDAAQEAQAAYVAAGGPEMQAKADHIAAINSAYDEGAENVTDYINEESKLFDVGAYLTAMTTREDALRNYQTTLAQSALSPEAKSFLDAQGADAAAAFLAGYKTATPAQQAELNRIWSQSALDNSNVYARDVKGYLSTAFTGTLVDGPVVKARVEVDKRELDAVVNRSYKVVVEAITKTFGAPKP